MNKIVLIGLFAGLTTISCQNEKKTTAETETATTTETQTTKETGSCFDVITETSYDIPAQRFDQTAQALAHASGCFIETDPSKTGAIMVKPIKGNMSIRDAVKMAIEGTELKITSESPEKLEVGL